MIKYQVVIFESMLSLKGLSNSQMDSSLQKKKKPTKRKKLALSMGMKQQIEPGVNSL